MTKYYSDVPVKIITIAGDIYEAGANGVLTLKASNEVLEEEWNHSEARPSTRTRRDVIEVHIAGGKKIIIPLSAIVEQHLQSTVSMEVKVGE